MIRRSFFRSTGVFVIAKYLGILQWDSSDVDLSMLTPGEKLLVQRFMTQIEDELKTHHLETLPKLSFLEPVLITEREKAGSDIRLAFRNRYNQLLVFVQSGENANFLINQ